MITAVIHGQLLTPPRSIATPETASIVAEIAERLTELEERRKLSVFDLIKRLAAIGDISPRMQLAVVAILHGNTLPIVESLAVMGGKRGLTKQAVHCEWASDLARVRVVFPDVAAILHQLRTEADNHELAIDQRMDGDVGQDDNAFDVRVTDEL